MQPLVRTNRELFQLQLLLQDTGENRLLAHNTHTLLHKIYGIGIGTQSVLPDSSVRSFSVPHPQSPCPDLYYRVHSLNESVLIAEG
jgi:hypothetical protein